MIRVLVADDQALVRGGLRAILESEADIEVAGEAADGHEALAFVRDHAVDVVLMDVQMPGMDGVEATTRITASRKDLRVLILTTFDNNEHLYNATLAGASGFLLKTTAPADLIHAVRVVAGGEALLDRTLTRRLLNEFMQRPPDVRNSTRLAELTARELEVLRLIGHGLSNAELAEHLVISHATAKTHVSNILAKTGASDRVKAVVLAYETGLVRPGESLGDS